MRPSAQLLPISAALVALAALSGCDKAKPRPAPPAAPAAVPGNAAAAATPAPPPPAWAAELAGKPLASAFPTEGACVGNTDVVEMRYAGEPGGTKVNGWGWDEAAKQPIARVVLVDFRDRTIVGAGETGLERPDVVQARPNITSETTGWWAITSLKTGSVDAYGVLPDGKSVCKLGHIDF